MKIENKNKNIYAKINLDEKGWNST